MAYDNCPFLDNKSRNNNLDGIGRQLTTGLTKALPTLFTDVEPRTKSILKRRILNHLSLSSNYSNCIKSTIYFSNEYKGGVG